MLVEQPDEKDHSMLSELSKVNGRLDNIEDLVHDILESGQVMDENLTMQLEEVRSEIAKQHASIKKMRRSWLTNLFGTRGCSLRTIATLFIFMFVTWVLFVLH